MGNQQGGSDYGGLYIRTDKPFYFAGELVTGNIYLNMMKDGFPGQNVLLRVSGKEKCRWEVSRTVSENDADGKSVSRTEVDVYHGKNQFYCHKIAIHQFQGGYIPRGQYTFPFQFTLLGHLPGSFDEKGHEYMAKISYKVKAEIESFQKNFKSIKHHQDMIVREPLKTNIQALAGEMEVKAKVWCCCDRGTSHIKCVFDKNNYLPGDIAYLWVDVDNSNCDLDVKTIQAVLTNYLTLRDKHGREKVFTRQMVRQDIQGIPSRSTAIEDNRKQIQMSLNDNSSKIGLKPSTNGQIVRSTYELSATAVLSGCTCCNSHPSVKVPIVIVAPVPITYAQPIAQPSNWNPQVFQPQLVQFSDRDLYVKQDDGQIPSNFNYPSQNPQFQQQQMMQ